MKKDYKKRTLDSINSPRFSDELLKRVGIIPTKKGNIIKKGVKINNLKMQEGWGQNWNLGNLQKLDYLNVIGNRKENFDLIDEAYNVLLSLNPSLKEIKTPNNPKDKYVDCYKDAITSARLDIIRGVASGLHLNDIKYFVENLKGTTKNQSLLCTLKEELAYRAFRKNYGENIQFALSPETIKRIKEDKPYQKFADTKDENKGKQKGNSLEGKVVPGIIMALLVASIFFLSPNLTGNVIGSMEISSSNMISIIFFILGIMGFFIYRKLKTK